MNGQVRGYTGCGEHKRALSFCFSLVSPPMSQPETLSVPMGGQERKGILVLRILLLGAF